MSYLWTSFGDNGVRGPGFSLTLNNWPAFQKMPAMNSSIYRSPNHKLRESCQQNNPLAFPFIGFSSNGKGYCQTTLRLKIQPAHPFPVPIYPFANYSFLLRKKKRGLLLIISFPWRCIFRAPDASQVVRFQSDQACFVWQMNYVNLIHQKLFQVN